jgi:hypothetical protein
LQRRKNRDLFDINQGLLQLSLDSAKVVACFEHYIGLQRLSMSRAQAEQIMLGKLRKSLTEDIAPLLPVGVKFTEADAIAAFGRVWYQLIARLHGDPWKLSGETIDEWRKKKFPKLLL